MKKIVALVICALFVATTACFAQIARNPAQRYEGKSNFANIGVHGLDVTGNAGYISISGTDRVGTEILYYLWVDEDGKLLIVSQTTVSAFSSFPTGDWRRSNGLNAGTVVGSQS